MFNIHYLKEDIIEDGKIIRPAGYIVSYQEGAAPNPQDIKDTNVGIMSFANPIPGFTDVNGRVTMTVDVNVNKLVLLNPTQIPDPLPNHPGTAALSEPA